MNLRFKRARKIQAPPDIVWMVISDPLQWPAFLDRIQEMNEDRGEYVGRILWKEREFLFRGRISDQIERERLAMTLDVSHGKRTDRMTVAFQIRPSGSGSMVTEDVEMAIEVNPVLGLLVRWIARYGRAEEPSNLDRLAELIGTGART